MGEAAEQVQAAPCAHAWERCQTPPDCGLVWFRCSREGCRVFGYRRHKGSPIRVYRCTKRVAGKVCDRVAIDREPGRGPRGSYLWVCDEHRTR